jgi:hypothetical protein
MAALPDAFARLSGSSIPIKERFMKADHVWEELCEAVALETDDKKLPNRLHPAKAAIDKRLEELQRDDGGTSVERQAISKAACRAKSATERAGNTLSGGWFEQTLEFCQPDVRGRTFETTAVTP